jgi:hypothetical protein
MWPELKSKDRILFIIIFLTLIPSLIFIRTFLLSIFLVFTFLYFTKSRLGKAMIFFSLVTFFIYLGNTENILKIIEDNYDRLPSLKFAWSVMTDNIFGLGNGGYHIYIEKYETQILAMFGSEKMIELNGFWLAPESDLVYFIASWGILSVLFFIYFIFVLIKGSDFIHSNKLLPIEKGILMVTFSTIFAGISQDNAGGLLWWSYMAAGSGVLLRHFKQNGNRPLEPKG